ncbi:MAG TPA: TolC family protein, partial [Planctomycetota bacterium]|nr:TolC family protein [Planctomycetota bacterium]
MPHHLPCLPPRRRRSAAALLLAALWVPACTVGPDYATPQVPLPENWPGLPEGSVSVSTPQAADASDAPAAAAAQRDAAGNASQPGVEEGLSRWWTAFHDDTLDGLVEQAIAGNLDVQRAEARVLEARAQRRVAGSGDEPQLNATADASRTERSANNTSGSAIPGSTRNLFSAGFDALWELDIFGGVRRNVEAADADLAAAQETRRDVLVTLLAEVSREYLDLRSAQRRVAIANDNLVTQQDTLELTRSRATAGLASDLDLARAEAQAAGTRATLPPLQTAERAALYRLDVLMGRNAGSSADALLTQGALPPPPPHV